MTKLEEFKQQYPHYKDVPDDKLMDAFYNKYYSHADRSEFNKRMGYTPPSDESLSKKALDTAAQAADFVVKAPLEAVKSLPDAARDVGYGALTGAANAGQSIKELVSGDKSNHINFEDYFKPLASKRQGIGADLIRGAGEYASFGVAGEAAGLTSAVGKLVAQLLAGGAAGYSNSSADQENLWGALPNGRGGAAIESALVNLLPIGVLKAFEKGRPANALRGGLSDDALQQNMEATKDTTTGLGDVIGNKQLKNTLETIAPSFPGTGATNAMVGTARQLESKVSGALSEMLGDNDPTKVNESFQNSLRAAGKDVLSEKKNMENELNKAADEDGIKVEHEKQAQTAKDYLSEIAEDPELAETVPESVLEQLNKYANGFYPAQKLKGADISGSTVFGEQANKYYLQGENYLSKIYKNMQDAKKADVDAAIDKSGSTRVKGLRDKYRTFYANEYAPFQEPEVKKFTDYGRGDTDLLFNEFLKTSQVADRSKLLNKLMSKLSPNQKNLVLYAYYSRALNNDGTVNLGKFASLHEKLGKNQEDVLFKHNKKLGDTVDNLDKAIRLNPEPQRALANLQTGQRSSQWAPYAAVLAGMKYGLMAGGVPGAILGAAGGLAIPATVGKGVTKALTSQSLRDSLVKAMLENKPKFDTKGNTLTSQAISQAILQLLRNGSANNG